MYILVWRSAYITGKVNCDPSHLYKCGMSYTASRLRVSNAMWLDLNVTWFTLCVRTRRLAKKHQHISSHTPSQSPSDTPRLQPPRLLRPDRRLTPECCPTSQIHPSSYYWGIQTSQTCRIRHMTTWTQARFLLKMKKHHSHLLCRTLLYGHKKRNK